MDPVIQHPFLPKDIVVEGFVPNKMSTVEILGAALIMWGGAIVVSYIWSSGRRLSGLDQFTVVWMTFSGVTHCVIDCYFPFNAQTIPKSSGLLDEIWKEYGISDSRFMTGDPFLVSMEVFTGVVLGPLCLLTAVAFTYGLRFRRSLCVVISVCQLYGVILCYGADAYDGRKHGPGVGSLFHFWFVYIFLNGLWLVACPYLTWKHLHLLETSTRNDNYSPKKLE